LGQYLAIGGMQWRENEDMLLSCSLNCGRSDKILENPFATEVGRCRVGSVLRQILQADFR
jgi:hypothetical protein